MWKERLWQVFLVVILGLTLTMCNRSGSNNKSSTSSNANAEGTTTAEGTSSVSVLSIPSLKVESLPTMTITVDNSSTFSVSVVNAGPNAISHTMLCGNQSYGFGVITYTECDASDDTVLTNGIIKHDAAFAAGWKLVGSGCSNGDTSNRCALFHK